MLVFVGLCISNKLFYHEEIFWNSDPFYNSFSTFQNLSYKHKCNILCKSNRVYISLKCFFLFYTPEKYQTYEVQGFGLCNLMPLKTSVPVWFKRFSMSRIKRHCERWENVTSHKKEGFSCLELCIYGIEEREREREREKEKESGIRESLQILHIEMERLDHFFCTRLSKPRLGRSIFIYKCYPTEDVGWAI